MHKVIKYAQTRRVETVLYFSIADRDFRTSDVIKKKTAFFKETSHPYSRPKMKISINADGPKTSKN